MIINRKVSGGGSSDVFENDYLTNFAFQNMIVPYKTFRIPNATAYARPFSGTTFPSGDIYMDFSSLAITTDSYFFVNAVIDGNLTIKLSDATTNLGSFWRSVSNPPLDFILTIASSTANVTKIHIMSYCEQLLGNLDLSSLTTFTGLWTLIYIEVKPNTMSNTVTFASTTLSSAGAVRLGNGLNESVTGKTLTIGGSSTYSSIMGTVAMDSTNTYHVFTEDASGTVSLEEFITVTKGWTLA